MRVFIFLLFLFNSCLFYSQATNKKKLKGYWESTTVLSNTTAFSTSKTITNQSLRFSGNYFQHCILFSDSLASHTDTAIYGGKFKIGSRSKSAHFKPEYELKPKNILKKDHMLFPFESLSDTSFTLAGALFTKKKKKVALYLPNGGFFMYTNASIRTFYLQNKLDSTKQIKLRNEEISMLIDETKTEPGCISKTSFIECELDSIRNDSMVSRVATEEISLEYYDHYTTVTHSYVKTDSTGEFFPDKTKVFLPKDIIYINYKNPFRKTMTIIGSTILKLSFVTIIATPLFGLKLSGSARSEARATTAIAGLSGFVVSLPFYILGTKRRYCVSNYFKTSKDNYWTLKEKFE